MNKTKKDFTHIHVGGSYYNRYGFRVDIVDDKGSSPIHRFRDKEQREYFSNGDLAIDTPGYGTFEKFDLIEVYK